jgi:hypothetical protein
MSTVIARRIASTPVRSVSETWAIICQLLAPDIESAARRELLAVRGVASSSIASEATKDAAIVVWGGGPRARIYTVFDDDAITKDGINEDSLPRSPTAGDWRMSIPCPTEDVAWMRAQLAQVSSRVFARAWDEDVADDVDDSRSASTPPMKINVGEFMKP